MTSTYEPKYWNYVGKYSDKYEELYRNLVPKQGEAPTLAGEILRITSKIYHDHFNNGGGNLSSSLHMDRNKLIKLLPSELKKDAKKFGSSRLCYNNNVQNIEGWEFADTFVDKVIEYIEGIEGKSAEQLHIEELERLLKFALDKLSFLRSEMDCTGTEMCDFDFCTVCGEPEYKHKTDCEALKWKSDAKNILKKVA